MILLMAFSFCLGGVVGAFLMAWAIATGHVSLVGYDPKEKP